VRWLESTWFAALGAARFDVIASNPPYVRSAEVVGALAHEPRQALDGGADGLDAYRVLLAEAPAHLHAGGALIVEHGAEQREAIASLAAAAGWRVAHALDDLAGRPRVLELTRSGA
jgi:release factor glutamine methyltransferase